MVFSLKKYKLPCILRSPNTLEHKLITILFQKITLIVIAVSSKGPKTHKVGRQFLKTHNGIILKLKPQCLQITGIYCPLSIRKTPVSPGR